MSLCEAGQERQNGSQEKVKACNKEAGEKSMKGDDWKKFMSTCLSN